MADLSKIKIPNGTEYNLKDAQARADIESLNGSLGTLGADLSDINDTIGDKPTRVTNVPIGTHIVGGLTGAVNSIITVTTTSSYYHYVIPVNEGEKYNIVTEEGNVSRYPNTLFFTDDNNVIKEVVVAQTEGMTITSFAVTVPTGATKLYILTYYVHIPIAEMHITEDVTVFEYAESKNDFTFYVSPDGSDSNSGDFYVPFKTFRKAISEGATKIYAKAGIYDESIIADSIRLEVEPYGGDEIIIQPSMPVEHGIAITKSVLSFTGVTVKGSSNYTEESPTYTINKNGFNLTCCDVKMERCKAIGCRTAGIRCDGSVSVLKRCEASYNGMVALADGFNAHSHTDEGTLEKTYPSMYLYDCIAEHNGDDGASLHEGGYLYVVGGTYSNNGIGGITPNGGCRCIVNGATLNDNKYGIDAFQDGSQSNPVTTVLATGNIIKNNTVLGIQAVKYNVLSIGNIFSGNAADTGGSEGVITTY